MSVLVASAALGGCSSDKGSSDANSASGTPSASSEAPKDTKDITVMVAASLCTFAEHVALDLKEQGITVRTTCGGSSGLVSQLQAGEPANLLLTADERTGKKAIDAGLGYRYATVVTNTLVLVTPADNPAKVTGWDASLNSAKVVVCAPEVPCGNATKELEKATGLTLTPVSEEQKVTDVLGKITSGQADAGVVYKTDAKRAGDKVKIFDIPKANDARNTYPLIIIGKKDRPITPSEQKWIDAFTGPKAQKALVEAGFDLP